MDSRTDTPILAANDLRFSIKGKTILKNISMSVKPGEIFSIIGPNGAGKTTLVRLLLGLLKPTSGTLQKAAKLKIGYMPQRLHIDPILPLTVYDFLAMGIKHANIKQQLEEVKIPHLMHAPMHGLSGGEFQRVLLARALLTEPNLLVLDEPAQGVDMSGQAELYQLIANIRDQRHCAIIIVSHNLQLVMAKTDYVICLHQHICCQGKPESVSLAPEFVRLFGEIPGLAFYTHQHDHRHTVEGEVIQRNNDDA